jgi:hypothetical protein
LAQLRQPAASASSGDARRERWLLLNLQGKGKLAIDDSCVFAENSARNVDRRSPLTAHPSARRRR